METSEYYIQKGMTRFSNEIFYRIGIWRFAWGYSYFSGIEITDSSVSFYSETPLGFGDPKEAVQIPVNIYHNAIKQLSIMIDNLKNWSKGLASNNSQQEAIIAFNQESWCLCNNSREIITENPDDGLGLDHDNWVGTLDGLNFTHHPNVVLDRYQEIINTGNTQYLSHQQFDLLNKALCYEYSLILRNIKWEYKNRQPN